MMHRLNQPVPVHHAGTHAPQPTLINSMLPPPFASPARIVDPPLILVLDIQRWHGAMLVLGAKNLPIRWWCAVYTRLTILIAWRHGGLHANVAVPIYRYQYYSKARLH